MSSLVWKRFCKHKLGVVALVVIALFVLVGLYAPFLASSKPLMVKYDGHWYFPLFRYLFYRGFFSKGLDLFFNLLMFTFPLFVIGIWRWKWKGFFALFALQMGLFAFLALRLPQDPARQSFAGYSWESELSSMNDYAQLNALLRQQQRRRQHVKLYQYESVITGLATTPWQEEERRYYEELQRLEGSDHPKLQYLQDRQAWLDEEELKLTHQVMPLLRPFHWQEDAGGSQVLNRELPWYELTRINRKDLVASLLFGVRISLVVGVTAVVLSLLIGIPLGSIAGYYGGRTDIFLSRIIEIWEAMPTFFMLLMVVAIIQSKSIFLVIAVLGMFGWTGFSRFLRGEVLKQRNLSYVDACYSLGFSDRRIMFRHILPNAIPPLLTLLPFSVMAAVTAEAGLSFLGLGEEGSTSWGVLMDEGRTAFPGESYLLWPPAIMLTLFLIAIALVGDALRDALDPKLA